MKIVSKLLITKQIKICNHVPPMLPSCMVDAPLMSHPYQGGYVNLTWWKFSTIITTFSKRMISVKGKVLKYAR